MTDNEIMDRLAKEVRLDDLQATYPSAFEIASVIGVDMFMKMVMASGGISLYIPKFENITAAARNRLIIQEFNNGNFAELARRYGLTETWVRDLVNCKRIKDNSISLFDDQTKQAG